MISIITSPAAGSTVQDALWHVTHSDASGSTDMRYVFDVYVNDLQKISVKAYPDPVTGMGYFDAGPTVRNEMTYQWFAPGDAIFPATQPNVSGDCAITYRVEYGTDISGVTTYNELSGNTTAYNYLPTLFKRRQVFMASKLNKFMTNRPLRAFADLTDNFYIPVYTDATPTATIRTYDHNNNLADTQAEVGLLHNGFLQMNIGPVAINATLGFDMIWAGVKYYTVEVGSETFRINLKCDCPYEPVFLHFLNAWGMFDTAKFGLAKKLTMEVERKSFAKRDFNTSGGTPSYYDASNKYEESAIGYLNKREHSYRLTMDAPFDDEAEWLSELFISAQVYAEIDGYYYPVTLKTNNYEYSKYINNRLRAVEVDIEIKQTRFSHLR